MGRNSVTRTRQNCCFCVNDTKRSKQLVTAKSKCIKRKGRSKISYDSRGLIIIGNTIYQNPVTTSNHLISKTRILCIAELLIQFCKILTIICQTCFIRFADFLYFPVIIIKNKQNTTFWVTGSVSVLGFNFLQALEGGEGSASRPDRFLPRERPSTHCTGGWVGPRAGLDRCGKSRPHRDSIPGPSRQ
jgi:hypothetical protein